MVDVVDAARAMVLRGAVPAIHITAVEVAACDGMVALVPTAVVVLEAVFVVDVFVVGVGGG